MIHNPRPVAGLHLRGRVSNVKHQAVQVLEFLDYSGGDNDPETVWMSVLRFVDTRRPGNAVLNPPRTWAIGWMLFPSEDCHGVRTLVREHSQTLVAWMVVGPEAVLEVSVDRDRLFFSFSLFLFGRLF